MPKVIPAHLYFARRSLRKHFKNFIRLSISENLSRSILRISKSDSLVNCQFWNISVDVFYAISFSARLA